MNAQYVPTEAADELEQAKLALKEWEKLAMEAMEEALRLREENAQLRSELSFCKRIL